MLFTSLLTACAFFFSSAINAEAVQENSALATQKKKPSAPLAPAPANSPCSKQLAAIVYSPAVPAQAYMAGIATELKLIVDAVLRDVAIGQYGLLANFLKKWGVQVTINSFFNTPYTFAITPMGMVAAPLYLNTFSQTDANLALGLDSFRFDSEAGSYFYGFVAQSKENASGAVVTIILPADTAAFLPAGCK